MNEIKYGRAPAVLNQLSIETGEMMHYLYLPIKLAGSRVPLVEPRLFHMTGLIALTMADARKMLGEEWHQDHYVYLTAKTLFVSPGSPGNRPGWHADGYGSDGDLNYIWHDKNPTEFAIQKFTRIPKDDIKSLATFEKQVKPECIQTFPNKTLLRLDESVVHRVGPVVETGVRTFIKVSISRHRYNLLGNSINYSLNYDWEMHDRADIRNLDNKDFVKRK